MKRREKNSALFRKIGPWLALIAITAALIVISPKVLYLSFSYLVDIPQGGGKWEQVNWFATIISGLATSLTLAIGGFVYFIAKDEEQSIKRNQVHLELNQRYSEYLKICLDNPDLPVQDYGEDITSQVITNFDLNILTKSEKAQALPDATELQELLKYKRTIAVYEILFTLMERAYVAYSAADDDFKIEQWQGWEQYIWDWLSRADFLLAYNRHIISDENDKKFMIFIKKICIAQSEGKTAVQHFGWNIK